MDLAKETAFGTTTTPNDEPRKRHGRRGAAVAKLVTSASESLVRR